MESHELLEKWWIEWAVGTPVSQVFCPICNFPTIYSEIAIKICAIRTLLAYYNRQTPLNWSPLYRTTLWRIFETCQTFLTPFFYSFENQFKLGKPDRLQIEAISIHQIDLKITDSLRRITDVNSMSNCFSRYPLFFTLYWRLIVLLWRTILRHLPSINIGFT